MKKQKKPGGVDLPVLDEEFWKAQAAKERALFAEATSGNREAALELFLLHAHGVRTAAPEVQEAVEDGIREGLLGPFLQAKTERNSNMRLPNVLDLLGKGDLVDKRQDESIEKGINPHTTRAVALRRAFGSLESTLTSGKKGSETAQSVVLDHFGLLLTSEDARKALTTDFNKRTKTQSNIKEEKGEVPKAWSRSKAKEQLDSEFWPDTLQEAERFLIGYVLHRWKKADPAEARLYVRTSFSQVDWSQLDDPDAPDDIPVPWEAFGLPR